MLSDTCREDKENEYTWYLWFKKKIKKTCARP